MRWASAAYAKQYPGLGKVPVGMPYREQERRVYQTGAIDIPPEEIESRLAQRLKDHGGPGHVRLQPMRDGRTLKVVERRALLGSWTGAAFDVSDLRATEQALREAGEAAQAANALLEDALDAMPSGFEIWGRDNRLLRCNRRLLDLYPGNGDLLQPGVRFETVLRRTLEQGMIPGAQGRETDWISERSASRGKLGRPVVVDYGGRWLQIDERRTRSGHLVCVRQDVTELVKARRALSAAQARVERQHRLLVHAINALPLGIEIYDEQGRLQLVNQQFRHWHPQIDYDALIGLPFADMVRVSQAWSRRRSPPAASGRRVRPPSARQGQ
ncbi:MAG: PAS-domain containing protein [Inhella sp.]